MLSDYFYILYNFCLRMITFNELIESFKKKAYLKRLMINKGKRKISANAMTRRRLALWTSTSSIPFLTNVKEFGPNSWKTARIISLHRNMRKSDLLQSAPNCSWQCAGEQTGKLEARPLSEKVSVKRLEYIEILVEWFYMWWVQHR